MKRPQARRVRIYGPYLGLALMLLSATLVTFVIWYTLALLLAMAR